MNLQELEHHYYTDREIELNSDFKNEKEFCDYIENDIEFFTDNFFGLEYQSHTREFSIYPSRFFRGHKNGNHIHADFLIKTECGKKILVECKAPKTNNELVAGIGQIIHYGQMFTSYRGYEPDILALVSTKINYTVNNTIKAFKLPIVFIALDKVKTIYSTINHFTEIKQKHNV